MTTDQYRADVCMQAIKAMCLSLADDLGYKITPDRQTADWVKVLANRAWHLADTIIAEERDNPEPANTPAR